MLARSLPKPLPRKDLKSLESLWEAVMEAGVEALEVQIIAVVIVPEDLLEGFEDRDKMA
jgi:hypothetical protein